MLFRSGRPATPGGERFGAEPKAFRSTLEGEVHVTEVASEPGPAVELFRSLLTELADPVELVMWCARSGNRFRGEERLRSEIDDTLDGVFAMLGASGGVEISLTSGEDQVTLSLEALVWVYSRSPRWPLLLQGRGFEQVEDLTRRNWHVASDQFSGAPRLVKAVRDAAERLTLSSVSA